MHIRGGWLGLVAIAAALIGPASAASAQQWAAMDAHNEGTGPVVWDADKDKARERAVAACRQASTSCSGSAAFANLEHSKDYVFAYMCCTRPRVGCAIGTATSKEEAGSGAIKVGTDGGLNTCRVYRYIQARTGEQLPD